MILINEKLVLGLLLSLCLISLGCSNDEKDNLGSPQDERIIASGTTDTIIRIPIDGHEVPVFLSIPSKDCNSGPLPAVVVMHGSDGMWSNHDPNSGKMSGQFTEWQSILSNNCIVGAFVDSYTGRGVITRTGKWRELPDNFRISAQFVRSKDANATLTLLQNLKYDDGNAIVHQDDVAILGFSDGGSAVAATLFDTDKTPDGFEWTQSQNGKEYNASDGVLPPQDIPNLGFSSGVFFYGGSVGYNYWGKHPCGAEAMEGNVFFPYAPMLYQVPSDDVLTENTLCLVNTLKAKGAPVEIEYYEGVPHGFDFDDLHESEVARNKTIEWLKEIWSKN